MSLVMDEEVRHLAGERHEQRADRHAHRWGKEDGLLRDRRPEGAAQAHTAAHQR